MGSNWRRHLRRCLFEEARDHLVQIVRPDAHRRGRRARRNSVRRGQTPCRRRLRAPTNLFRRLVRPLDQPACVNLHADPDHRAAPLLAPDRRPVARTARARRVRGRRAAAARARTGAAARRLAAFGSRDADRARGRGPGRGVHGLGHLRAAVRYGACRAHRAAKKARSRRSARVSGSRAVLPRTPRSP